MANEFKHKTVGSQLTQAEFESVGGHEIDSQAIGDILYASSTTQIIRLGIGSTNALLTVTGGVPAWSLTPTVTTLDATTDFTVGDLVITDGVLTDSTGLALAANVTVTGNVLPNADDTYDLGSASAAWQDLFLEGDITLSDATTIATTAGNLTLHASAGNDVKIGDAVTLILIDGGLGNITFGTEGDQRYFFAISQAYTSGGSSAGAILRVDSPLTGATGNTSYLSTANFSGSIVTQTATQDIGVVSQVYISAPGITDNLTGDITVAASLYIHAAPTAGESDAAIWVNAGDLKFGGSVDSATVADQVAIGGYEIGGGNRVLAISQETGVATETDETKFSHKMQVRINGSTYYVMLTAS